MSPSMDIQISSNFERYLFDLCGQNAATLVDWMNAFQKQGQLILSADTLQLAQKDFQSQAISEEQTLSVIREVDQKYNYLLDPHTTVGVGAALSLIGSEPMVCLATAHPAKFGDAVQQATGRPLRLPEELGRLTQLPTRCKNLASDPAAVMEVIRSHRP